MIVAPQQKKFTADAKAALHLKGLTARALAKELGVHVNSVHNAINLGVNRNVLDRVCKRLEIKAPAQ